MLLTFAQDSKLHVTPCALLKGKGQALRPSFLFLLRRKGQALHQRSYTRNTAANQIQAAFAQGGTLTRNRDSYYLQEAY